MNNQATHRQIRPVFPCIFQLTVADLAVYNGFDTPLQNFPTAMDKYPKLKAQRAMISALPKIQEYLTTRKHSDI